MKRKTYFITVALIIFSFSTRAQTIYVDVLNTSGTEDGTQQYPFKTVAEGIEAANIGDTVYIFAGVYDETNWNYLYLKDGLVITGEDSSTVIINTGFRNSDTSMNHYTEVSNIKFTDFSTAIGDGTATIVVKQCRFQSARFASGDGYTYIIENCTIDEGIGNVSGECYMYILNNTFINGRIEDRGGAPPGIEAHIIENNNINNDGLDYPWEAVIHAASHSVNILNNIIVCASLGSGIDVSSGTPTNIIGNDITLNNGNPLSGTHGIETSAGYGVVTDNIIRGGYVGYYSSSGAVLFENNTITEAFTGFMSSGNEEVKNNKIKNCSGDGMILMGLRGPVSNNIIKDNAGSGIRITRVPIDLGGGDDNSPGLNVITGNGNYDLYVEKSSTQFPVLYARYNVWDHTDTLEIMQYDIHDGNDSSGLIKVSFTPAGYLGMNNALHNSKLNIFPNPLSQSASINWVLTKRSFISLKILDFTGKLIKILVDEQFDSGEHQVVFDASNLPEGMYFCQLQANGIFETVKMLVYR